MAKEIQLTKGKVAIVDDEDFDRLNQWKWCAYQNRRTFYAVRRLGDKKVHMHHLLMPKPVDHVNGNGLDNRRCNLRQATNQQNCMNQRKILNAASKFKGIHWKMPNKKWVAQIRFNYKLKHLGYYESEIEAAKAYNEAAKRLFGKFARLNDLVEPEPTK